MDRKWTLFQHIIMMTLIPVVVVFTIVIFTLNSILNTSVTNHTTETVRLTAEQISDNAELRIEKFELIQYYISTIFAGIDCESPYAKDEAQAVLESLMTMASDAYHTWYAFEPGYFGGEGRSFYETIRMPMGFIREANTFTDELLDTAEWYQTPLRTGTVFYDALGKYEYDRVEEGSISILSIVNPIIVNGVTVGCVGMDIRYEALLRLEDIANGDLQQKIMAVSQNGAILFSFEGEDIGRSLKDFGFNTGDEIYNALLQNDVWIGEIDSPFFAGKSVVVLYPFNIGDMAGTVYLYRGVSRDALYAKYQTSMEVIVASGILGGLLISFSIFFSTRRIVVHIKRVMEQFGKVADIEGEASFALDWNPMTYSTRIYELDQMQKSLGALVLHMQKVHYLKIEAIKSRNKHEKLLASTQAKTTFFASMSHEIRTPMNAIIGIAEIMLTKADLTLSQERDVRDISTASNSLLSLIDDIMDVSKMETGKITLHAESYDLEALLDNVVSLGAHLAAEAGLQFQMRIEAALPKCLYGDDARVRQILLNLLGNAVKYTPKGSVTLRVSMQGYTMRFDVTDTGIGIREKDFESIFESFKRVDGARNRKVMGTGLGLPISRHLAEAMGGSLMVRSVYGEGSTFTVMIPVFLGDEKKLKPAGAVTPKVRFADTLKVLIVDDNRVNLNVSSGLMKVIFDVNCDLALSGQEAIDMVQQKNYDLVFMDHMMPGIDGAEATRQIRGLSPAHRLLPIIALTANAVIGTREELLDAGMDDFLPKPVRREDLQEIMHKWVPKSKQIQIIEEEEEEEKAPVPEAKNAPGEPTASVQVKRAIRDARVKALAASGLINVQIGLENIGFDEEMYFESVMILCRTIPETLSQMSEALPYGDIRSFEIFVHGIKGSFMSIGMESLAKRALSLEEAAKRGDVQACENDYPSFNEAVTQFRDEIVRHVPEAEAAEEPEDAVQDDIGDATALLGALRKALKEHNYEAIMDAFASLRQVKHSEETGALLEEVRNAVDNFDYESAAKLLESYES